MALVIVPNCLRLVSVPRFPVEVRHEENLAQSKKKAFIYSLKNMQHIKSALEVYIGLTQ